MIEIVIVPELRDNYGYLVLDATTRDALIVDASDLAAIEQALGQHGARPLAILSTHHHPDHTAANEDLVVRWPGLPVIGHASDRGRLPGLTRGVEDGALLELGPFTLRCLHVPCHTRGHLVYVLQEPGAPLRAFVGDTLFSAGAGRLFEGTAADLHHALVEVIGALPDDTWLYPGHEYTANNLRFAATLEPHNAALAARREEVQALRTRGEPTVPVRLVDERAYNPFLRAHVAELCAAVHARRPDVDPADPIAVLGAVRALKDGFQ